MSVPNEELFKRLKKLAKNKSALLIESNEVFRGQIQIFLAKFFEDLFIAATIQEGLSFFSKQAPDIVFTDFKMPESEDFALIEQIRSLNENVPIVIISDKKELDQLSKAMEFEVFRFLAKPISAYELSKVCIDVIEKMDHKKKRSDFQSLKESFNYQNALMFYIRNSSLVLANERFLNFFDVATLEAFKERYRDSTELLAEQKNFLSCTGWEECLKEIAEAKVNHFNVKLLDPAGEPHYFLLSRHQDVDDTHMIVSLTDMTSLGLLPLFELQANEVISKWDFSLEMMKEYLEELLKSGVKLSCFNYYKGIAISHETRLISVFDGKVTLRSSLMQNKAILREKKTWLDSPLLPQSILLERLEEVKGRDLIFKIGSFTPRTAMMLRRTIRLEPAEDHMVILMKGEDTLAMSAKVRDISLATVTLEVKPWIATFKEESVLDLDMVFMVGDKKSIIATKAKIYKITKEGDLHVVVLSLAMQAEVEKSLSDYLQSRKKEIVQEFKNLELENAS